MKKFITTLAVMLLCLLAVPASKADAAAKLSKTKTTVYVGNQTTLKVTGTSKKVTWSTSNKKVATVKNGKVTAKKKGTAVITAKVSSKKYTCKVTVKNQELNKKTATLRVGSTLKLKVNGAYKKVTWKSSNKKVVTVTSSGKIKAVAAGSAKVTAKHNGKSYTCKVTVKKPAEKTVVVKIDREFIDDKESKQLIDDYLKQLDIKSQKSDQTFVYYTVTETSYKTVMSNIKKDLDKDIATFVKSQPCYKKVNYNSSCTKLNMYIDTSRADDLDKMTDEEFDKVTGQLLNIYFDCLYYQIFSGVKAESLDLRIECYDIATGEFIGEL